MSKRLHDFGCDGSFNRPSLSDVIGFLEALVESEVERLEKRNANLYGNSPSAVRLDLVEEALTALQSAENGDRLGMLALRNQLRFPKK